LEYSTEKNHYKKLRRVTVCCYTENGKILKYRTLYNDTYWCLYHQALDEHTIYAEDYTYHPDTALLSTVAYGTLHVVSGSSNDCIEKNSYQRYSRTHKERFFHDKEGRIVAYQHACVQQDGGEPMWNIPKSKQRFL
jgi:hypothetical protein